ncbi:MAG TPA: metallophosphoesterase [Xanthobacteraceae bacterium]|nr:metallophosphoesterase [Xanthobacteraceae bacterium]
MRQRWIVLSSVIVCALLGFAAPQQAQAKILSQWVQLGADGSSTVRAISDDACPSVTFDGNAVPMSVRSEPTQNFGNVKPAQFAVRGCEVAVPAGSFTALLDGKPLPLPQANPRRIVMFGDTGCRLKTGDPTQACNEPNAWPFPKVAAAAAATHPDLVIHVGDYEYREEACPAGNAGCAGSPFGYGWDAWNADFFQPATPLLAAAPWIMVRGNHEDCSRAGEGWFRFLDRAPMEPACRDLTGDYVARLGDFSVVVVDSAKVSDTAGTDSDQVPILRRQLIDVLAKIPAYAWLATHKPVNGMLAKPGDPQVNIVSNTVLQAALGADMPANVRMDVAGHIHFFQAVDFGGVRPPQLVVGTGGDNLEGMPAASVAGADINGLKAVNAVTYSGFGYMVWDRVETTIWTGTLFDIDGKPINRCRLADRSLSCGS